MAGRAPCLLTQLTVEGVFEDFEGRRAGLVKALTTDVEEFYNQCDPENVNLCLFGFPSGKWEVNLPAEEVPPELPEPALGINFARDVMGKKDWLSLVAVHSEAWLLAVAYFLGIRIGFDKADRKRLFHMINDLPSLFEVVTCTAEKEVKKKKKKKKKSSISKKMQSKYEHEGKKNVEDMDGGDQQSVKGVFRDFRGRRAGLLKALTTDVEEFFQLCDPEKENLFLYGFPSKKWEVSFPVELLLELPEPALGINFARDAMQKMDWLSLIAAHSDAWLLSVAYFFGARFDKADRYSSRLLDGERTLQYGMERLFDKINNLPTLFEVVSQTAEKEVMEKSSNSNRGINESKSNLMEDYESQGKDAEEAAKERSEDEYLKEYGDTMCGVCGLFLSFTGNIFGRWQMTIGNGYDPCPKRKI